MAAGLGALAERCVSWGWSWGFGSGRDFAQRDCEKDALGPRPNFPSETHPLKQTCRVKWENAEVERLAAAARSLGEEVRRLEAQAAAAGAAGGPGGEAAAAAAAHDPQRRYVRRACYVKKLGAV